MVAFFVGVVFGGLLSFVLYALIYVGSEKHRAGKQQKDKDGKE